MSKDRRSFILRLAFMLLGWLSLYPSIQVNAQNIFPQSTWAGVVLTNNLRLRNMPTLGGNIIALMKCNEPVDVLGFSEDGQWYRVRYQKIEGFAYAQYIGREGMTCGDVASVMPLQVEQFVLARVVSDKLNVRAKPTLGSPILGVLSKNDILRIYGIVSGQQWLMISYQGGYAFVYAPYTDFRYP